MTGQPQNPVRLTPELQAEYQQIYNDPAKKGSPSWTVAAHALHAAGIIQADPSTSADLRDADQVAESSTEGQSL